MKGILDKISSKSINYYIENNLDDFYIKSAKHPNFISQINERLMWVFSKHADWPECIFRANFEKKNIEDEINQVIHFIKEAQIPNGWTIGPLTFPSNLGSFLEKSGFKNVYQQAGMAADLKSLIKSHISQTDLKIIKIESEMHLKEWKEIVSQVFNIRVDFELLEYLLLQEETKFYLGTFKGTPVSALMLYLSSGVAGLHAVSTLSEYRSKGFGLIISKTALIDAFYLGYQIGVLQASSLGERVYRKLGFKKYCDVISYTLEID
ncbi:MAG: GNAT family N-acetyltransferase [Promethearchaeota archaeon]